MRIKEQVVQHTVRYAASVALAQVALCVGGLTIARFLGPTHYGLWNGLQLILLYASYFQLGIVNALNREVPLQRGMGDLAQAEQILIADASTGRGHPLLCCCLLASCHLRVSDSLTYCPDQPRIPILGAALRNRARSRAKYLKSMKAIP